MNLTEFEVIAGKLLQEQKRLKVIDMELTRLSQEIKQDPKRNEKDKAFYALIGMSWSDPGHGNMAESLKKERDTVQKAIGEAEATILDGLSQPLVVPLDPTPQQAGGSFAFRFRSGATFPSSVEELSETLGIPVPLRIGDVTIHPDQIVVSESDEYFAKKKVVDSFEDVRKAVRMKLSP